MSDDRPSRDSAEGPTPATFVVMIRADPNLTPLVPGDALLIDCTQGICWMSRPGRGYLVFLPAGTDWEKRERDTPFLFAQHQPEEELPTAFWAAYGYDLTDGGRLRWPELKERIGLRELRGRRKFVACSTKKP